MAHPNPAKGLINSPNLSLSVEERCRAVHDDFINDPNYAGFDLVGLKQCRFVSASAATKSTVWELTVTDALCNKAGNMHGGAAATILDNLTSTALLTVARPGFLDAGHVSRTLTCTYLRPVPRGTYIVTGEVVAAGKTTAHVRGEIKTLDGKVCVACTHDKHVFQKSDFKL